MAELKNLIVEGDTRLVGDTNAGKITATSIKTSGGTASQFVKGDGSLDSKVYTPLFNSTTTFDFSTTTPVAGIHRAYGITNPVTGQTEYGSVISGPNTGSTGSPTAQIVVSGIAGQTNHVHGYIRRLTDNGWTPWSTIVDNHNYSAVIPTATTSTSGIMSSSDKTALNSKVTGPASSTANRIATFSDTTGKVIKDSGYTISTSVPSGAVFTDTHRPIQMNGTQILASNTTPLNLKAGKNIKLSNSSGTVTIENGCYVIYADYNDLGGGW